jgi:hypothetical protein
VPLSVERLRGQGIEQFGRSETLCPGLHLSLSRLNHWLPGCEAHPKVMECTAEFHHEITDTLLPQPDPVFDDATAFDTAVDMLDAQPAVVQSLIGLVLLS